MLLAPATLYHHHQVDELLTRECEDIEQDAAKQTSFCIPSHFSHWQVPLLNFPCSLVFHLNILDGAQYYFGLW